MATLDGGITAAIIAAAAAVAQTVTTEVSNAVNATSGVRGLTIENGSTFDLQKIGDSTPYHGQWGQAPLTPIGAIFTPEHFFEAWIASGAAPKDIGGASTVDKLQPKYAVLLD